ncbi:glycosyltransferase family protein [Aliarcobacter cryaerophilus]|uniref:hypothetical protein n=1 Tax=Aliarcobacter cryaerophilus TaxID=28198 RepID=UPI0021B2A3F5|nr:hypothetical protein [Aliarcobacter cryaerophilus]MCT7511864.1 hypothetical protein [Aliarcobacter cryaerophilus]
MNSTKKDLYFFFPYKGVGGVPVLFLRLANYLEKLDLYNIFLIDYQNGYMANNYNQKSNIRFISYSQDTKIKFEDNDIVVFQSMPLWGMPSNLVFANTTKLIYWNLHPYNMFGYASSISKYFKNKFVQKIVTLIFRYFIYPNDRKAVKIFHEKKSIFFMDGENYINTKELLDIEINQPIYLPLVIDNIENIKQNYTPNKELLNCIWIGRIGDFKVHILLYSLKKLNEIAKKHKKNIIFTVVGTGEYLEYLKEETSNLSEIEIKYIDYIDPLNLKEFLKDMDIGFAMGTAALDFAKYGLPTVLLDFSYEELNKDYKFDWLYNTKDFTLGRHITDKICKKNNSSLEDMLSEIGANFEIVSQKSFAYIKNSFAIKINVNKFIDLIEKSSLIYADLDKKYFQMNMFHKFISAKKYYND